MGVICPFLDSIFVKYDNTRIVSKEVEQFLLKSA